MNLTLWVFPLSPCFPSLLAATSNSSSQYSIRPAFMFECVMSNENRLVWSVSNLAQDLWKFENDSVKVWFQRRSWLESPGKVGWGVEVSFCLEHKFKSFAKREYLVNLFLSIAVDEVSSNYILLVNLGTACELRGSYSGGETEQNCQVHR